MVAVEQAAGRQRRNSSRPIVVFCRPCSVTDDHDSDDCTGDCILCASSHASFVQHLRRLTDDAFPDCYRTTRDDRFGCGFFLASDVASGGTSC